MGISCANGKTKASVSCNHWFIFDEIITNGCSLIRRCSSTGQCLNAHTKNPKSKMDGPQLNVSIFVRGHQITIQITRCNTQRQLPKGQFGTRG